MYYKTGKGFKYDLSELDDSEQRIFTLMIQENGSGQAISWEVFQAKWEKITRGLAVLRQKEPETYVLSIITADLARNIGIQHGKLKGELSDMLID